MSWSTRVVFPWSTWAITATLRTIDGSCMAVAAAVDEYDECGEVERSPRPPLRRQSRQYRGGVVDESRRSSRRELEVATAHTRGTSRCCKAPRIPTAAIERASW